MRATELKVLADPGVVEDLDLGLNGEMVAAVRSGSDVRIVGAGWSLLAPRTPRFPLVRFLNSDWTVLVDGRTEATEPNAWILDRQGKTVATFFAGDAIQDVRVVGDILAFTYFDEAYGSAGPAGEGISLFDMAGRFLWGYQSQFGGDAVDTMDVYASCTDEGGQLWFFPYTEFPLVQLDVQSRHQRLFQTPEALGGSAALSVRGEVAYFANPYKGPGAVFEWSLGTPVARRVASVDGRVRGLSGGRFLVSARGKWTLLEDLVVAA